MRIVVVEDEEVIAERLERLLREINGTAITSIRRCRSLDDARDLFATDAADLVLLDLNLSGEDGFDLLGDACAGSFRTIVVSAHADQAARAFEYGVTDFVVKPFTRARLERALLRAANPEAVDRDAVRFLAVRRSGGVRLIPLVSIVWISGADDYSEIHLDDGSVLLHDRTLATLETLLPRQFLRVHRSAIVATAHVRAVRIAGLELEMSNGDLVPLSRRRSPAVKVALAKHLVDA